MWERPTLTYLFVCLLILLHVLIICLLSRRYLKDAFMIYSAHYDVTTFMYCIELLYWKWGWRCEFLWSSCVQSLFTFDLYNVCLRSHRALFWCGQLLPFQFEWHERLLLSIGLFVKKRLSGFSPDSGFSLLFGFKLLN